jgi:Meiotic cell cortex C-terminal pleckstrin homology
MPKGSVVGAHFNRSILILTPERALKFTATSQDRHFIWLTALSFLSHSPLSVNDLTVMPPPLPDDRLLGNLPPPSLAGSLRRRPIRDSIRVAKGSNRQQGGLRSFTTDGSLPITYDEYNSRPPSRDYYDPTQDAAMPPTIKRFHARKRSNTAPRAPPSSFRGFPASSRDVVPPLPAPGGYAGTVSSSVIASTNGSDRGLYTPSLGVQSINSSRRGSESSYNGRPNPNQLFVDHTQATMRMDAFADAKVSSQQPPRLPMLNQQGPFPALRSGTLRKKDPGHWGFDDGRNSISPVDSLMHSEMMAAESSARPSVDSRMTDPFRGF